MSVFKTLVDGAKVEKAFIKRVDYADTYTMASGPPGSTDYYGKLDGGIVVGIATSGDNDNYLAPCGRTTVSGDQSAVTEFDVTNAALFFVGDTIDVVSGGVAGAVTIDGDGAAGADIDLTGTLLDGLAHKIALVDPAADHDLEVNITRDTAGVYTVTVILEYSGAALQSTVTEVIAAINGMAGGIMTAALADAGGGNTAAAVAATALVGAVAEDAVILNDKVITAVDKTNNTITTATSFSPSDGDEVKVTNGADTAIGILRFDVNTVDRETDDNGARVAITPSAQVIKQGVLLEAEIIGLDEHLKADLGDHILWTDR